MKNDKYIYNNTMKKKKKKKKKKIYIYIYIINISFIFYTSTEPACHGTVVTNLAIFSNAFILGNSINE